MKNKTIISRRTAIKNLTVAGSSLAVLPLACSFKKSEDKKLGVALVGLGNYATRQLGPALLQTQFCKLQGIITGTPEKETKWQKEYNISPKHTYNYENFDSIKDDPTIDIVYICLLYTSPSPRDATLSRMPSSA